MAEVPVVGGALESVVVGSGEPVLFVHGSFFADAFAPLRRQAALQASYRLIMYNRRGFGRSVRYDGPCSIADQALDAKAVLDFYGLDRAHLVGHSYGCRILVELALHSPERVATLTLAEPGGPPTPSAAQFAAGLQEVTRVWERGDNAETLTAFIRFISGAHPGARAALDRNLPAGWWDTALADLSGFFEVELPARAPFDEAVAARLLLPTLAVGGTESLPFFRESHAWVLEHVRDSESLEVVGATHALQLDDPATFADGLARFLARHPLERAVR